MENKFDINLKFYFFLKYLVKIKFSSEQITNIIKIYATNYKTKEVQDIVVEIINKSITQSSKKSLNQKNYLILILDEISSLKELKLFIFSLKLYVIKDLLLQEAKLKNLLDITKLENIHPLSLEYDKITLYSPYSTRVNGALLALIFFDKLQKKESDFISNDAEIFIKHLSDYAIYLKDNGIESNQIFMLMFNESINQSIISESGSNYEERILNVLLSIGIDKNTITKEHDKNDSSTEFDFFFELCGKTYGIGAKKTLRERYKQFIKTAQMSKIDVMIEITLGVDLTQEKVNSIRNHNIYLFVADEVYKANQYLQNTEGVYSASQLSIDCLKSLK